MRIESANGLYVARTYAFVASGAKGMTVVDVEKPEQPRADQVFDANGAINDARDVKIAMTNASVFAYVADGRNGLRVLQLVSANRTPGAFGFSRRPAPELIATCKTSAAAVSISKGLVATAQSARRPALDGDDDDFGASGGRHARDVTAGCATRWSPSPRRSRRPA